MHLKLKTAMMRASVLLAAGGFAFACKPQSEAKDVRASEVDQSVASAQIQKTPVPVKNADLVYNKIQTILASSCMPCHNRQTLPEVIVRTEKGKFKAIGDDTRLRILGELGELHDDMRSGMPISFTSKEELHQFFGATAGEFYSMLEKGRMPPPWAPELMQQINWPKYQKLTSENRFELMKYAKPYTEKFLR